MKKFAIAGLVVLGLALTGCAKDNQASPEDKGSDLGGNYKTGTIMIDGEPLFCVDVEHPNGNATYGGFSCDWVAFHGSGSVTRPR